MILKIKEITYKSGKKERRCFVELEGRGELINIDMLITDYDVSNLPREEYIKRRKWQEEKIEKDTVIASNSLYEIKQEDW